VATEEELLDLLERTHRRDLQEDVDAVGFAVDHALQALHLPFDPPQPSQRFRLGRRVDH